MSIYPGTLPPPSYPASTGESEFIREASMPLYQARGWLKFLAVLLILGGIPSVLGLIGVIPIWQGVLLWQAASSMEMAATTGQKFAYLSGMSNIKTFFILNGVLMLIGVVIAVIALCLAVVLPLVFGVTLLPFLNSQNW